MQWCCGKKWPVRVESIGVQREDIVVRRRKNNRYMLQLMKPSSEPRIAQKGGTAMNL